MANKPDYSALAARIKQWGHDLGFQQTGITDTDLSADEVYFLNWLEQDMHGEMEYMSSHGVRRSRPSQLVTGTIRIISLRMTYHQSDAKNSITVLNNPQQGFISRYALGRDYHKIIRNRLRRLAGMIQEEAGEFGYRAFVDSAPVLEKALARKAGLGWFGKHSNLIHPKAGSWFFLGELYTDLPLPVDKPFTENHCGTCTACMDICPTQAIIAPYQLDARRCISYLTIELRGSIPVEFRSMIGNRIFGCDDCQLVCPWNRFSSHSQETDFSPRHDLDSRELVELFHWTEAEFLHKTEGMAIRRIGYQCWLRNIAVALGNAPTSEKIITALQSRRDDSRELVREHVRWALEQHGPVRGKRGDVNGVERRDPGQ